MNPFHEYLDRMLKGVRASEEAKRELYDELLDHLQQLRAEYAAQGLADEHAVRLAVADFGDSGRLGGLLNTAMSPYRKWFRASAWVALRFMR
ncbi:hypothetical protein SAMN02799624_05960 [Paenibacillus sp. UNC496MF]|uniref:permease prefix domain 1-containing protein n=1 Tax=Paenibacillus sp. UNC496MF TaxID=1502753 RepID=UPI0008EF1B0B|nr:permease prefix domain 1-containing protein [Paenibacillus sp. UNC496MF]SFJ79014.1 hypothetical protein SAMN02799624_05960 [Paenibacillus sp. UNC496MF]